MALSQRDNEVLDRLLGKADSPSLLQQIYDVFLKLSGYHYLLEEFYSILSDPAKIGAAWNHLYTELKKSTENAQISFIRDHPGTDFKDVFQDAFSSFYNEVRKRKYQGKANLNTYFQAILKNQIASEIKKNNKPDRADSGDPSDILNNEAYYEESDIHITLSTKTLEIMRRLAAEIGDDCVKRLDLFHVEGLRHHQVAQLLDTRQATNPRRLANDCAHRFRTFFCEHPHLLEYMGRMDGLQSFIKSRKQVLIELNDYLGENCSRELRFHNVCAVHDGHIEHVLKNVLEKKILPDAGIVNHCQLKTFKFFASRKSDLNYFGIRLEQGRISANPVLEN